MKKSIPYVFLVLSIAFLVNAIRIYLESRSLYVVDVLLFIVFLVSSFISKKKYQSKNV